MSDIQKGRTFTDSAPDNTVTAADLNNLIDQATILPSFVGEKPSGTPQLADCLLVYQASTAQFCKATIQQIVAFVPPPPLVPVIVGDAAPGAEYRNGDYAWIKTGSDTGGLVGGLKIWNEGSGAWEAAYSEPPSSIVRYGGASGAPYFDPTGLGILGRWRGWALCNGQNGTPNLNGGGVLYIQLVS